MKSLLIWGSVLVGGIVGIAGCGASDSGAPGGAAGQGNASAGSSSTNNAGYPSGPVVSCFGDGCPLGECDNSQFLSDTRCASLYSSNVGPASTYCKAGGSDGYCLEAGSDPVPIFAVSCAAGKPTIVTCTGGGCSSGGGLASCE